MPLLLAILAQDAYASREGYGFVETHCIACHGDKEPKADMSLSKLRTEAAVLQNRKIFVKVLQMLSSGQMPPKKRPRPTLTEIDAFGAVVRGIFDRADRNAKPDPGRVTFRRLNRTEYRGTVLDLLGVDFDPTEDFPSDDIGFGFDNIGDVLTLSPMLMERYLAAAENIASRAFPIDPPSPTTRRRGSQELEPPQRNPPDRRFRSISEQGDPSRSGPLSAAYALEPDAEYLFRFRAYADKPARAALLACGKDVPAPAKAAEAAGLSGAALSSLGPFRILKTVDVKEATEKQAQSFEIRISPLAGVQRLAVALVKGSGANLFVGGFSLQGPLDARPAFQKKLLSRFPGRQTRELLSFLASRAYRRPARDSEVSRLAKIVDSAEKWEGGIQQALTAILVSPKFLFRIELDDRPDSLESHPIGEFPLASRLSYFLWSSMPDEELAGLAAKNQLSANLDAQVRRMLKDSRARSLVDNFAMQWLQLKRLSFVAPDGRLFPDFNDLLRRSMLTETELFIDSVFREDRSILDLISADYTFVNGDLARLYGLPDPAGSSGQGGKERRRPDRSSREKFVRASLAGTPRGGLLTLASVLTVTSNPTRTSPVKRGRWILEQILGAPPPPPPGDVPEFREAATTAQTGTLRQRMEEHRKNPSCASCHERMDPLGFALENFDAIGAWRTKDGPLPIDASGVLPDGRTFQGIRELRGIILKSKSQFAGCFVEKLMTFALGRGLEYYDKRTVDWIVAAAERDGYRFSSVVSGIVRSDPFRLRRGKSQAD